MALLPLLQGLLSVVVRTEEEINAKIQASRAKRGSARELLSKIKGDDQNEIINDDIVSDQIHEVEVDCGRRWRRTLRSMFNSDAVIAFQNDLLSAYNTTDFEMECKTLESKFPYRAKKSEKLEMIHQFCSKNYFLPLLPVYGFSSDEKGRVEITNIINNTASKVKEVQENQVKIMKLQMSNFDKTVLKD